MSKSRDAAACALRASAILSITDERLLANSEREGIHEVCHMRSTDRRRTQARSATASCEILLEVQGEAAAPCKSKVRLADGARRLSQKTLFRGSESSLSGPHPHGSHDRIAAMVHQAAGRTVGFNNAN